MYELLWVLTEERLGFDVEVLVLSFSNPSSVIILSLSFRENPMVRGRKRDRRKRDEECMSLLPWVGWLDSNKFKWLLYR